MLAQTGKATRREKPRHIAADKCKVCGCTDDYACDEGCSWVTPGFCSACLAKCIGVLEFFAKGGVADAAMMLNPTLQFLNRVARQRLRGLPL